MKCKTKLLRRVLSRVTLLTLTFLFLFLALPIVNASITVPTTTHFGIPLYNTYISFSTTQTLSSAYRESDYWYFTKTAVPLTSFQVQNANMTITDFFSTNTNTLGFTITAPATVTSTTKIVCATKGEPVAVNVDGVVYAKDTNWTYDETNSRLTLTWTHSSDADVVVTWFSGGGGGDGNGATETVLTLNAPSNCVTNANITVTGNLKTVGGNPLSLEVISLSGNCTNSTKRTNTDSNGNYKFWLTAPSTTGAYTLHVFFAGEGLYASSEKNGWLTVSSPAVPLLHPIVLPAVDSALIIVLVGAGALAFLFVAIRKRQRKTL